MRPTCARPEIEPLVGPRGWQLSVLPTELGPGLPREQKHRRQEINETIQTHNFRKEY